MEARKQPGQRDKGKHNNNMPNFWRGKKGQSNINQNLHCGKFQTVLFVYRNFC